MELSSSSLPSTTKPRFPRTALAALPKQSGLCSLVARDPLLSSAGHKAAPRAAGPGGTVASQPCSCCPRPLGSEEGNSPPA